MPLAKAELMGAPNGPGVIGAVKAGSGITISGDGTISTSGGVPSPAGQTGKFLASNGSTSDWAIVGVYIGNSPPTGVATGSLYWDNNLGEMFVYYNSGGKSQWVQSNFGRAV